MKKFVLLGLVLSVGYACKKDRTCECSETRTGTSLTTGKASLVIFPGFAQDLADTTFSTPLSDYRTYERKYIKTTKRAAKKDCISYSEPFLEKTTTSVPSASFQLSVIVTNSGTATYDCQLK
jgi:hypothetical protein